MLVALDAARLMVPVVAVLAAEDTPGPGGLRRDKSSEMALPTVIGRDGRAAIGLGLGGLLAAGRGARGQDEREDHEQGDGDGPSSGSEHLRYLRVRMTSR